MVAYSFQKQFAEPIIAGTKRQTIRAPRLGKTRHARPGDALQLYTGMRTKQCRKIGDAVCEGAHRFLLNIRDGHCAWSMPGGTRSAGPHMMDDFARSDGFADWSDMKAFFAEHHPGVDMFEGILITWRDFTPAIAKSRATAAAAKRRKP